MSIFRKDDLKAIKELDKDLERIGEKVKNCDESIGEEFLWFGWLNTTYEHDKELEHETAEKYFKKALKLSNIFINECKCK